MVFVEIILVELQGERKQAHQVCRQRVDGLEIIDPDLFQIGGLCRPDVGSKVRAGGLAGEVGIAGRHIDRTDRQRFLEVRRRRLVQAVR